MNKLLIHEEPLQVLPSLAAKIGLNEAIMLQQIHYWLRKSKNIRDGKPWIYNTYTEWEKQFPWWSNRTIKRIVDNLRSNGLIETTSKYNKLNIDQTLWYTINYEKLDMRELTESTAIPESDKMAQSEDTSSTESDKMSSPKVTSWHNGSDKLAQSEPVAESDKMALPLPRDIQENTTRENSACVQAETLQPETPPPTLSPDDYLPGLPDPRKRKGKHDLVAEFIVDAKRLGVDETMFRSVVDALLVGFGKKPLADAGDDRVLNFTQDLAVMVMAMSEKFRTPSGIDSIFASWKENDYRGDTVPTSDQFKEHASLIASNKVTCNRRDKQPPKPTAPKTFARNGNEASAPKLRNMNILWDGKS